jgi:hypothetical protein
MDQIMFGAELDSPEFGYMLALVDAQAIVGVDAPELFPTDDLSRDSVYSVGKRNLGEHGWLMPAKESPNEYDLNPILFEATAIIAAPEIVIATMRDAKGDEGQLVQHYVNGDEIVELSATVERKYRIGILSDKNVLFERMAELLNLAQPACSGHFVLDEQTLISIQGMCQMGKLNEAMSLMRSIDVNGAVGESFVASLGSPISGQVVVVRTQSGEIKAGRRAMIFGEGKGAWMLVRTAADSHEFKAMTCSFDSLKVLVEEWWERILTVNG